MLKIDPKAGRPGTTDERLPLVIVNQNYKSVEAGLNRFLLPKLRLQPIYITDDLVGYYRAHGKLPADWQVFVTWYAATHEGSQRWSADGLAMLFTLHPDVIDTGEGIEKLPLVVIDPHLKSSELPLNHWLLRHIGIEPLLEGEK